jgi:hypothetical protein
VLSRARACGIADAIESGDVVNSTAGGRVSAYSMSLVSQSHPRFAGMDTGPRCWLWVNELRSPVVSALCWAEMIPSGSAFARLLQLHSSGAFGCVFLDAGGEPDLTKRIVLALNGLDQYSPPVVPADELRRMTLQPRPGLSWDGGLGVWRGIKAAAVSFSLREAGGLQQDVGITQDGRIYPLVKCNRSESLQGFVNDFLTPAEGVIQHIQPSAGGTASVPSVLRTLPRQRLPSSCIGPGVSDSLLDTHLLNLRRVRDARTNREDWADGVENHLGLAGTYARLAAVVGAADSAPAAMMPRAFDTERSRAVLERRERSLAF